MLTAELRHSATWVVLKKHLEGRLDILRRQNDGDMDERRSARLRGRIAEVKAMLALGEDKPRQEPEPYIE